MYENLDDLVYKFKFALLKNFRGGEQDYTDRLKRMCEEARDIGIRDNIRFFGRQFHKRKLREKSEKDINLRDLYEALDDLSSKNGEFWKALDAKYRYFYKDIK